jgi:hypothetical protein
MTDHPFGPVADHPFGPVADHPFGPPADHPIGPVTRSAHPSLVPTSMPHHGDGIDDHTNGLQR